MRHLRVLLTCAVVLSPGAVGADPVTMFSATREVRASAYPADDHESGGDALAVTAVGAGATSSAILATSVSDPHNILGSGTALTAVTSPTPSTSAFNTLRVGFSLTSPHAYSFEAAYTGQSTYPPGSDIDAPSSAAFFSYGLGADASPFSPDIFNHFAFGPVGVFNSSGILQPGGYWFAAHGGVSTNLVPLGSASGGHSFSLRLTEVEAAPVPEPGSMLLLGTGLAGIARAVRRRR